LGALPLFFEERSCGWCPDNRIELTVADDDPLDDDPAKLLPPHRGGHADRLREFQDPRPVGIERADPDGQLGREPHMISLWTPRGIGWASVYLGYPGANVLAAMNWRRMGRPRKAIMHVAAGIFGAWALLFTNAPVGLSVGLIVSYYRFRAQRTDQRSLVEAGRVTERRGLLGL